MKKKNKVLDDFFLKLDDFSSQKFKALMPSKIQHHSVKLMLNEYLILKNILRVETKLWVKFAHLPPFGWSYIEWLSPHFVEAQLNSRFKWSRKWREDTIQIAYMKVKVFKVLKVKKKSLAWGFVIGQSPHYYFFFALPLIHPSLSSSLSTKVEKSVHTWRVRLSFYCLILNSR